MKTDAKPPRCARNSKPTLGSLQELCPLMHSACSTEHQKCIVEPIIEDLPVGVAIVDSQGRFTVFNREAKRILGMGPQPVESGAWPEVYGCYLPDRVSLYPGDFLPLARALRGERVNDELMFIRNPAQPQGVWIRVSCSPLSNIAGERGWAGTVFTDVTERKKAAERVELLSRAVEQTADSVVITDQTGRIEYVNEAFELTTGYSREEAIGRTPRILKSGLHDAGFYQKLWTTILGGGSYQGTLQNRKKSGEMYWAEQTIAPITNDAGDITHFVSVLKDITASRKQQEQQIQMRLARQVQQRLYTNTLTIPGLDAGAAVYPAEQTGGDYVDFLPETGQSLGVVIGDVSAHGFGAALVMALTRAYTRSFCAQGLVAGKVLNAVNLMLRGDLEQSQYVTLLLVHIDLADGVLSYANAGHVPGFILGRSGEVEATLESTGVPLLPLGVLADHRIGTRLVPLHPGRIIILMTDGVTEAGEPEQFGTERVIAYVRQHRSDSAQQIADGVYRAARTFAGNQPQQDDIAVVILKSDG